jgi:hypothetical protein
MASIAMRIELDTITCLTKCEGLTQRYNDTVPIYLANETAFPDALVQVQLWEAFLLTYPFLSPALTRHSYDCGPFECENLHLHRTCYRFAVEEWPRVRELLIEHRVPVLVSITRDALLQET